MRVHPLVVTGSAFGLTEATHKALRVPLALETLPAQQVKGHSPVDVLRLRDTCGAGAAPAGRGEGRAHGFSGRSCG